jgi:NAD(P)-dependent dehydrogenase (short-subunit alcohol dehydrogenase family)
MNNLYRSLKGKIIVVTDGCGKIGKAITLKLLDSEAKILCGAPVPGLVEVMAMNLKDYESDQLLVHQIDLRSEQSLLTAVALAVRKFGRIDGLINCAGKFSQKPFTKTLVADLNSVIDLNLYGAFRATQAVCQQLLKQANGGVIVNICAVDGVNDLKEATAYAIAQAGLLALTRQIALEEELAKHGIRCLAIAPGYIPGDLSQTYQTVVRNLKPTLMGSPDDCVCRPDRVAELTACCLSEAWTFMNGNCLRLFGT